MLYQMLGSEAMFNYPPNHRNGLLNFDLGLGVKPDHSASNNTRLDKEKRLVLMFQMMKRNQDQSMPLRLFLLHAISWILIPFVYIPRRRTSSGFTPRMLTSCSAYLWRAEMGPRPSDLGLNVREIMTEEKREQGENQRPAHCQSKIMGKEGSL